MANPEPKTIREQIAWAYANLSRAHAALKEGAPKYSRVHHIIRNKVYHGLMSGQIAMRSLYDDERIKLTVPQACYYCGSLLNLVVDHLIPRIRGGPDLSDNLVWACRSCNSSKRDKDMVEWTLSQGSFPPILLLRRYMKLVARYCEQNGLMDADLCGVGEKEIPFDLRKLPTAFPPLSELKLWVYPGKTHE